MSDAAFPWRQVPGDLSPTLHPRMSALADEIIAAVRREVPEYDKPLEGEFGRLITGGVRLALEQFVDLLGTRAEIPDASVYRAMGRAELQEGRTLDALQSAYRTGARVAWRWAVAEQGDDQDPHVMYALAEAIFVYIDQLADASVAGYTAALAAREGSALARRHALVRTLVTGAADADELAEAARQSAWTLPRSVALVACDHDDPAALARRAPDGTLAARVDGDAWLVVGDLDGPGRRARLTDALAGVPSAVGPAVPLDAAPRSAARAATALALVRAGTLPSDGPLFTTRHRLDLLLAADPGLAGELIDDHLAPLSALTPAARARSTETLRAWLDAHGDVSAAAALLHVHPQTVRYRLGVVRDQLGDAALDDPDRRLELALALRADAAGR